MSTGLLSCLYCIQPGGCCRCGVGPVLQVKQKLSEDDMEQLMDALEKMHHAELQKHPERWANLIGSPLPAK